MDHQAHERRSRVVEVLLAVVLPLLGGCLERELKPLNPCLVSGVVAEVKVTNVDKIDLLFMVDNSSSMKDEQASLAREFPKLITVLTSGDRTGDGVQDFPPVKDLHLGVVSSDLGLPGITTVDSCKGLGDDGRLQGTASAAVSDCSVSTFNPPFLSYSKANNDDPLQLATDFSCIATLGIDGCGFEQQLESVLKAVWPSTDARVRFVKDTTGAGMSGNGGPGAFNGDFIRNDPNTSPSLIALVLVTDEEDCSSDKMDHFLPNASDKGLNTRCFFEGQRPEPNNLYDVERYIDTFKALRPGNENLVIFAGIVGVPERLVKKEELDKFDFQEPAEADAFFDGLLAAPEMQEMVETMGDTDPQNDNLRPSCDDGEGQRAFPPRRIVQVAKGFGANGVIQSICQDNFGPAMDAIISAIVNALDTVCLPRPLVRNSEGLVECNVIWELPVTPMGDAPTECAQRSFLLTPDVGHAARTKEGGAICKVAQLAVTKLAAPNAEGESMMAVAPPGAAFDQGWYYDEFSKKTQEVCAGKEEQQRIGFSPLAEPPTGVTVKLECLNETQSLANTRTDVALDMEQPAVGDPCKDVMLRNRTVTDDEACVVVLAAPVNGSTEDRSMFCHAESQVCVERCTTDADCPASWVCDARPDSVSAAGGSAFCTNPTCGSEE